MCERASDFVRPGYSGPAIGLCESLPANWALLLIVMLAGKNVSSATKVVENEANEDGMLMPEAGGEPPGVRVRL